MWVWGDEPVEARNLADSMGIEHHVADEREAFRQIIVQNFIDEYRRGRTPNPCVMCNPLFKFRILTEWADRLGCAFIATGHYTRLEERNGKVYIVAGDDDKKDQSYFLWRLGQEVLKRCIFPLGSLSPRCRFASIFVIKDIRLRRKKGKAWKSASSRATTATSCASTPRR